MAVMAAQKFNFASTISNAFFHFWKIITDNETDINIKQYRLCQ